MAGSLSQPVLLVLVASLGFTSAFSFESLIEPLMIYSNQLDGDNSEFALEKLSELGRLVDDTARNFFNLTIGTSSTLTYGNALFVIFAVSLAFLGGMALLLMGSSSVLTGTSVHSNFGKRSVPDDENEDLLRNWGWVRILEILDLMEEQFQGTGASRKNEDQELECRKLTLCKLFADAKNGNLNETQSRLVGLSTKLSELVGKYGLNTVSGLPSSSFAKITEYLKANQLGTERGDSCENAFPKCAN